MAFDAGRGDARCDWRGRCAEALRGLPGQATDGMAGGVRRCAGGIAASGQVRSVLTWYGAAGVAWVGTRGCAWHGPGGTAAWAAVGLRRGDGEVAWVWSGRLGLAGSGLVTRRSGWAGEARFGEWGVARSGERDAWSDAVWCGR